MVIYRDVGEHYAQCEYGKKEKGIRIEWCQTVKAEVYLKMQGFK